MFHCRSFLDGKQQHTGQRCVDSVATGLINSRTNVIIWNLFQILYRITLENSDSGGNLLSNTIYMSTYICPLMWLFLFD